MISSRSAHQTSSDLAGVSSPSSLEQLQERTALSSVVQPRRQGMAEALRSGLNADRLVRLMRDAVDRCRLDLHGAVVFTEAATGAYAVTPILAAMAGARRVYGLTRTTSHGTAEEVIALTRQL